MCKYTKLFAYSASLQASYNFLEFQINLGNYLHSTYNDSRHLDLCGLKPPYMLLRNVDCHTTVLCIQLTPYAKMTKTQVFFCLFESCPHQFQFINVTRFSVTNFMWSKCSAIYYWWVSLFALWLAHSMKCEKKYGISNKYIWLHIPVLVFRASSERTLIEFLLSNESDWQLIN